MNAAPAQHSLASRLLLFAFGSTLASALVIGWVAIDSTHRSLQETVTRTHPASVVRAARITEDWIEAGRDAIRRLEPRIDGRTAETALAAWAEAAPARCR